MLAWVEKRSGVVSAVSHFLKEQIPGGASFWYVFGSAAMFALMIQAATGVWLMAFYAPAVSTAWESTRYIREQVPFGKLIISLHYWGASAVIAIVVLHMLQTLVWGAYKRPRELQWIIGVVLLGMCAALGLSGQFLPWDMNAYNVSHIVMNIVGSVPFVGPPLQVLLQGGIVIGTMTLSHIYAFHVWLLPLMLVVGIGFHLVLFRRNGPAGPPFETAKARRPGPFWPNQVFFDTIAAAIVATILLALATWSPAPFHEKADPSAVGFRPYPAWYFLAYGQFVSAFSPHQWTATALAVPAIVGLALIALPFIDRRPSRHPLRRPFVMIATATFVYTAVRLTVIRQLSFERALAADRASQGIADPGPHWLSTASNFIGQFDPTRLIDAAPQAVAAALSEPIRLMPFVAFTLVSTGAALIAWGLLAPHGGATFVPLTSVSVEREDSRERLAG